MINILKIVILLLVLEVRKARKLKVYLRVPRLFLRILDLHVSVRRKTLMVSTLESYPQAKEV